MTPVARFTLLYVAANVALFALVSLGMGQASVVIQPALIIICALASGGQGVRAVFAMLAALVAVNLAIALGFAGPAVIPALWSEYLGAPVILTLWMLSALIVPGLLIAGGVWLRHIAGDIRRRRQ